MIRCQTCGTQSVEGSQYCDECGAMLSGRADNLQKKQENGVSNLHPQMTETPIFQSSKATSVGIAGTAPDDKGREKSFENGQKFSAAHAALVIERGELTGTKFALAANESEIGRWDADGGIFPDVDLDRFDPEAKISRRHARIIRENGKYLIEDLGSTNGTFINRGKRLLPGNKNILTDGDEIIVGKTFLRFYVNG